MKFPTTNKQPIQEKVGDNAKLLEESISKVNWRTLLRAYFIGLGVFLVTIFSLIVTVLLAFSLF